MTGYDLLSNFMFHTYTFPLNKLSNESELFNALAHMVSNIAAAAYSVKETVNNFHPSKV